MLNKKDRKAVDQVEFVSIDALVPKDDLLRAIEASIEFEFIYEEVKDLYSENLGRRPSIDPIVLIKLIMLQALYGIRSMRQTIQEVEVNVAYRWFLGYGLQEQIPHFSTFGKNYERRFKESDLFEKIFAKVLEEAIKCGFIKSDAIFIDATHVKASANKNKYTKKMARHRAHKYKRDLLVEINKDRQEHGKKNLKITTTTMGKTATVVIHQWNQNHEWLKKVQPTQKAACSAKEKKNVALPTQLL